MIAKDLLHLALAAVLPYARSCLEDMTESDPNCALAIKALGAVTLAERVSEGAHPSQVDAARATYLQAVELCDRIAPEQCGPDCPCKTRDTGRDAAALETMLREVITWTQTPPGRAIATLSDTPYRWERGDIDVTHANTSPVGEFYCVRASGGFIAYLRPSCRDIAVGYMKRVDFRGSADRNGLAELAAGCRD